MIMKPVKNKAVYVAIFSFLLFCLVIFLFLPKNALLVDEFWQYWQSKRLIEGSGYHLDVSPSPLHNLIFSIFPSNIIWLRLSNALLMSLAIYIFYKMVNRFFGDKIALISTLVFLVHGETIVMGSLFYTESLFLVFYLLTFNYFIKLIKSNKLSEFILFGLWAGLMIQSRLSGIFVYLFLFIYLAIKFRHLFFSKKFFWSFCITAIINLPYLIIGGLSYLVQRKGVDISFFDNLDSGQWVNFLLLILIAIFFLYRHLKEKSDLKIFMAFSLFYFSALYIFVSDIFPRHFFPLMPFLIVILISGLSLLKVKKLLSATVIVAFLFFSLLYFRPDLAYFKGNFYWLNQPKCFFINQMNNSCQAEGQVELPYHQQEMGTECEYTASFVTDKDFQYIFFSYIDDYSTVIFDQINLSTANALNYESFKIDILPGQHKIQLEVSNKIGPGGIGQIGLCEMKPNWSI